MTWTNTKNYTYQIINKWESIPDPLTIAAFDLDETLVHMTKSKDSTNTLYWKFIDDNIPIKIQKLMSESYAIVIFSNQSGLANKEKAWKKALDEILQKLAGGVKKYYLAIYVAKSYDLYRKPNLGLWNLTKHNIISDEVFGNERLRISTKSFFCGDAAGRLKPSTLKKKITPNTKTGDFSDTDRKFAANIGITFYTPEEFLWEDASSCYWKYSGVDPKKIMDNNTESDYVFEPLKKGKEFIVIMGPPGAGKTEFVTKNILPYKKYTYINQDLIGTKAKTLEELNKAMEEGKSIVVDATNPSLDVRKQYIKLAVNADYDRLRCIEISTPIDVAMHMNNVRHVYSEGKIPKVPKIAYNIYKKNYTKPTDIEGFDIVETVNFSLDLDKLQDKKWKRAFFLLSEN